MTAFNHRTDGALMGNFLGLRVGQKLGEGRLGEVFELLEYPDAPLGSRLVLKRIHPYLLQDEGFRNRLRALFERLPLLRHPYAEEVLEARLVDQSTAYLICERLDGESLAVRLRRDGRLSLALVRQFARQAAEVLTLAHSMALVHGNLTPRSSIIIQPGREDTASPLRIKLRGFGCGPPLSPGLYGTPSYLAPEQVDPRDPRPQGTSFSDQHALACVCHEALVGRLLFPGETVEAVRPRLVRFDAPHFALRGVEPVEVQRVDHALQVALAKDPSSRFESLRLFVDALEGQRQASRVRPAPQLFASSAPQRPLGGSDSAGHRPPLPLPLPSVAPPPPSGASPLGPLPPGPPPAGDSDQETQRWSRSDSVPGLEAAMARQRATAPALQGGGSSREVAAVPSMLPRRSQRLVPIGVLIAVGLLALLWRDRLRLSPRVHVVLPGEVSSSSWTNQATATPNRPEAPPEGNPSPPPIPVVTQLPQKAPRGADNSEPPRSPDTVSGNGKGPRGGKKKSGDLIAKTPESEPVAPSPPRAPSRRSRGHSCRADQVPQELLWVARFSSCLEHALPAASYPQNFELQVDRQQQLVVTEVNDPEVDTVAQGCAQRQGAVDERLFPDSGLTVHCR